MESDASRTLDLELRDGTERVIVSASLINNVARTGAVLAMALDMANVGVKRLDVDICMYSAGPLVQFLEAGTYAGCWAVSAPALARRPQAGVGPCLPLPPGEYIFLPPPTGHLPAWRLPDDVYEVYEAEVACYAMASGVRMTGLMHDIERSLYHRLVVTRTETVSSVRLRFARYDRIDAMCNMLDPALITRDRLVYHLRAEGGLVIFHGDKYMTLVFDTSSTNVYHPSHEVTLYTASNPSNKRYMSFLARRATSFTPDILTGGVLLTYFTDASVSWQQMGVEASGASDGTDTPLFPPLHTIDAAIGLSGTGITRFMFTRKDLWQVRVDAHIGG